MSAPSTSSFSVITVTCYRRKIWFTRFTFFFWQFIKRALFGLACLAYWAARGEHASSTFLLPPTPLPHPRLPPKKKMAPATQSMICYDEGT